MKTSKRLLGSFFLIITVKELYEHKNAKKKKDKQRIKQLVL
jgi:hypothetical protein